MSKQNQAKTSHKCPKPTNQELRSAARVFILVSPLEKGEMSQFRHPAVCSAQAEQQFGPINVFCCDWQGSCRTFCLQMGPTALGAACSDLSHSSYSLAREVAGERCIPWACFFGWFFLVDLA